MNCVLFNIGQLATCPRLVGMESTLAGWHSTLFSETRAAAVYCGIMKPELTPVSFISSLGRPSWPCSSR